MNIDKLYCLNLYSNTNRRDLALKEFDRLGLDVEIFKSYNGGLYNHLAESCKDIHSDYYISWNDPQIFGRVLSCSIGFYNIMKDAQLNNYEHIMIFEDDIKFNVNREQFDDLIDKIPKDADTVKFYWKTNNQYFRIKTLDNVVLSYDYDKDLPKYDTQFGKPFYRYTHKSTNTWVMFSKKATNHYINTMDNNITFSDSIKLIEGLNNYICIYNVCECQGTGSSIC